jgi:nucleoside-diphosphate-sugar epimerase
MSLERPLPPEDLNHVRLGGAALWPELRGARILITGATGFFGRWLVESLLSADGRHGLGVRIFALSRAPDSFLESAPHLAGAGLKWLRGSVATLEPDALGGEEVDMVVHLATEADLRASRADPVAAAAVITEGTRRTLALAVKARARRFLFTSSGAVYGRLPPDMGRIPESYPGRPDPLDESSPYALPGEAKRQAELICEKCAREDGLGAVIARCFTFAGPGLPADSKFAFGNFMRDALCGETIVIEGDGTPVRTYLHAADLAIWLWALLLRGTPGRAYNVGSEQPVSLLQLAETIATVLEAPGIEVRRKAIPGAAPDRYVPSTQRARDELGLSESFSLPEIVRRTAAWHRTPVKR